MFLHFLKYFLGYIFHSKTRQRLIFIAIVGLFLSSFSLLVLESIMGGLQDGLIKRSKSVHGEFEINIKNDEDGSKGTKLVAELTTLEIPYYAEYEIELLIRNERHLSPIILHGIDTSKEYPPFLRGKDLEGIILGADLGAKVQADFYTTLEIISPAHTDSFFGDIPRQVGTEVSDFFMSELSEIDLYHAWVRLSLVQNLIRESRFNKIRIYDRQYLPVIKDLLANEFDDSVSLRTWEDINDALVWSLNLETTVMMLLFISMSLLISVTVTSGFMIFFDKVKKDFASFWILGSSRKNIMRLSSWFLNIVSFFTCLAGIGFGLLFLMALDHFGPEVMPDVFVERRLPIKITAEGILVAFGVPYLISYAFSIFSLNYFKKENTSFLEIIRNVG
jgi:lipoprotein-releasing system permease protein